MAPEQIRIVPVADRHAEHAAGLAGQLRAQGLRAEVDQSRETVQKKIRESQVMKVPYTVVVGDKEIAAGTVSVRDRSGIEVRGVPFPVFLDAAGREARARDLTGIDLDELAASSGPTPTV